MKTSHVRSVLATLFLGACVFSFAYADTAATPSPFSRTLQPASGVVPILLATSSPSPNPVLLRLRAPIQTALSKPNPPTGFLQATIGDCDRRADVRAVTGGSADSCRLQMNAGAVAFYWNAYPDFGCAVPSACQIAGYDIVNYRTKASVAKVAGQHTTAAVIAQAKLGDCFSIRSERALESADSYPRCVLVVRSTVRTLVGPSEVGQFQALIHDNADHSYCTRNSWDSTWAQEPWGFSTAIHSQKQSPGNTGAGISLTIGHIAQEHEGTHPFNCPESLAQIWRGVLDFDLPAEAKTGNPSIVFAFTPGGVSSDYNNCFQYLWNPHRWYIHEGPTGQYTAPLIGEINGKVLDHDNNALGVLTIANGRASYDFGQDPTIQNSGHLAVELAQMQDGLNSTDLGNPQLHSGNYLSGTSSTFCGAKDPRLELTYVKVQTTAQPVFPQIFDGIDQKVIPHVFQTAVPN